MKRKKLLAALLSIAMLATTVAGCGDAKPATDTPATNNTTATTADGTNETATSYDEMLTIDVYDGAANYQGVQIGWFAKVIKDKFNMELNIIAPQVAGDAIFQTRASTGNLGDIVLIDRTDYADCVKTGLIKDITDKFASSTNLQEYKKQIDTYNQSLEDNAEGKIYGIPCQMTNTSPTSYSQDVVGSSPLLRWDLYAELGCPEIADLDGLLDVLKQMMDAHPTNAEGDPAYPFSLWPDWDNNDNMIGIANAAQLTTWYGEKIKGSAILKPDNTFVPLTDKTASYYKMVKFLNKANNMGLVDPDSGTQDWNAACAKMSAGQVYLMWYNWQVGFWNSQERLTDGTGFIFIPVKDQTYYADSDTYFGADRVIGVGSQVEGEKYDRIIAFLDWYASPEGLMFQHDGIEGFNYTKDDKGVLTAINSDALMNNLPVPEEWGGAGYQDGNNAINQWIVDAISTNPLTGEPYSTQYWSTWKAATMTDMKKAWQVKFGAEEPVDYMKNNNVLLVSPSVSVQITSDSSDMSVIRNQCGETVKEYSWKMVFAKDDAKFDALWDEMSTKLDGFGFQDLVKFDEERYQVQVDAKIAAAK
ncbi:MAG TPA: sugar ABC transporter substrate-binding protein [Lachnospiraceae bacterium]|nr:sugar ABC transporter substrate-binding protein [Lachnospiraceae bacterium]